MVMIGRSESVARVAELKTLVVLIAGDSGVGKSEFLISLEGKSPKDLVPGPRLLGSSRGSLQTSLVDQLSEALWTYGEKNSSELGRLRADLIRLFDRASVATTREISKVLLARLLSALKGKFGEEVVDLAKSVAPDLLSQGNNPLADRLSDVTMSDLASHLLSLADDIAVLLDGRVVLRLDQADVLADDDLALLGEISSREIERVRIYVTFSTVAPDADNVLARLEARGAGRLDLYGLLREDLEGWLAHEQIPRRVWASIERATNGYPFFVVDAIELEKAGTSLEKIAAPNGMESLLKLRWGGLDPSLQVLGLKLAAFAEVPSDEFLRAYLGLSGPEWTVARNALRSAGVFVDRPDGTVWFHDRRRNYIWQALMTDSDRADLSNDVLSSLREWQTGQTYIEPWVLTCLPRLVSGSAAKGEGDSGLRTIVDLGRAELCLLFSIIELVEPGSDNDQFVDTSAVVSYSTARFGEPVDPVGTLERLQGFGLVHVASNDRASIICLVMRVPLGYPTLLATIEERIGRLPVPHFASTMFDYAIRPMLGPFLAASIGVGFGGLRAQVAAWHELRQREVQESRHFRSIPALGVVATAEGQEFTSTIIFNSNEDREVSALRIGQSEERADGPDDFQILSVENLPAPRVPWARFAHLQDLLGLGNAKVAVPTKLDLISQLEARVQILNYIGVALPPSDSSALGITTPSRLLIDVEDEQAGPAEFVVSGSATPSVTRISLASPADALGDPLLELKFRRDALIGYTERIQLRSVRSLAPSEIDHPFVQVVKSLSERGREFNRSLDRITIVPDERQLALAFKKERDLRESLLVELARRSLVDLGAGAQNFSTYVELWLSHEEGWGSSWRAERFDFDDGQGSVRVVVSDSAPDRPGWDLSDEQVTSMGFTGQKLVRSVRGFADGIVGALLGFDHGDIRISSAETVASPPALTQSAISGGE